MRDYGLYLEDILQAIKSIQAYTRDLDFNKLKRNRLVIDAVIRNLEIIGEAVKNIPADVKKRHTNVEWKKIAGLRDILAHEYFGIDLKVLWDIIKNKLPEFKKEITGLLKEK